MRFFSFRPWIMNNYKRKLQFPFLILSTVYQNPISRVFFLAKQKVVQDRIHHFAMLRILLQKLVAEPGLERIRLLHIALHSAIRSTIILAILFAI